MLKHESRAPQGGGHSELEAGSGDLRAITSPSIQAGRGADGQPWSFRPQGVGKFVDETSMESMCLKIFLQWPKKMVLICFWYFALPIPSLKDVSSMFPEWNIAVDILKFVKNRRRCSPYPVTARVMLSEVKVRFSWRLLPVVDWFVCTWHELYM